MTNSTALSEVLQVVKYCLDEKSVLIISPNRGECLSQKTIDDIKADLDRYGIKYIIVPTYVQFIHLIQGD